MPNAYAGHNFELHNEMLAVTAQAHMC